MYQEQDDLRSSVGLQEDVLLLVLTSYLFVRGPRLRAWHNFFCPLRLFPVFDCLASFDRPRFFAFSKNSYEEGNYTYFENVVSLLCNTVNVLSSFFAVYV